MLLMGKCHLNSVTRLLPNQFLQMSILFQINSRTIVFGSALVKLN